MEVREQILISVVQSQTLTNISLASSPGTWIFSTRERKQGACLVHEVCAASQNFHWHISVAISTTKEVSTRLVDVLPHPVALAQQLSHQNPARTCITSCISACAYSNAVINVVDKWRTRLDYTLWSGLIVCRWYASLYTWDGCKLVHWLVNVKCTNSRTLGN